jgi:hypothetical protein
MPLRLAEAGRSTNSPYHTYCRFVISDTLTCRGWQVDKLPIPYSFSDMSGVQHPAVSTRSSVFFAVNPSLAMFKGFARGCLTEGYEWSLQLSALSSYAPIKIWRIDPFAYCPYGPDGTER